MRRIERNKLYPRIRPITALNKGEHATIGGEACSNIW